MHRSNFPANQNQLICGYVFSPETMGRSIGLDEVVNWLNTPRDEASAEFIWIHFDLSKAYSEQWMRTHLHLPEAFFEALVVGSRSTRIEDVDENLIAVINDIAFKFSLELSEISTLWVSVNQKNVGECQNAPLKFG